MRSRASSVRESVRESVPTSSECACIVEDMSQWQPLFQKLRAEHSGDVLHEGVPEWLKDPLIMWVNARLTTTTGRNSRGRSTTERATQAMRDLAVNCRLTLDWRQESHSAWQALERALKDDGESFLEAINWLLAHPRLREDPEGLAADVEKQLTSGGSAWRATVKDGPAHLERRVPTEIIERYEVVSSKGRAGEYLRTAWIEMYGRNPDASKAYRQAVSAVEAAGEPTISPNNKRTTLGTMIRDFKAKPEKWNVPLGDTPEQGRAVLLAMMEGVWHGQTDRHGTADEDAPLSVNQQESEAALHTAITLVYLFTAGLVTRNES